jgi:hypothetical protein
MNAHGPAPYWTSTATLYWRSIRRVERRARRLRVDPSDPRAVLLLAEAARTTNRLYWIAYRPDLERRHPA